MDELRGENTKLQTQNQATKTKILTKEDRKLDSMIADKSKKLKTTMNKLFQSIFWKQEIVNNYEFRQGAKEKKGRTTTSAS